MVVAGSLLDCILAEGSLLVGGHSSVAEDSHHIVAVVGVEAEESTIVVVGSRLDDPGIRGTLDPGRRTSGV